MSQEVTSIRISDEKCETNGGIVYYVTYKSGRVIRLELSPDMAEHLSFHSGVAISAR
jgi:hypothetical protein